MPYDASSRVESDVAATIFARLCGVPVPRILTFDPSGRNLLGLEVILMERCAELALPEYFRAVDAATADAHHGDIPRKEQLQACRVRDV